MKYITNFSLFKRSTSALILALLITILLNEQLFAQLKATLNQKEFYQGDLITLKIESDKSQNAEPDLSALENNFNIKGSSASSQISIINGTRSYKKTWNIELQAKSVGQFTIPEIPLGNDKTEALVISINELPPEMAAETKKHIFLEATVDIKNAEIYVQQQIPYTVKFYYDAAMQTGEVILPTIENGNLRVVGNEKKYEVVREGIKYVVVERRYVISPEKSGSLVIPPTIVQGRMAVTNGNSSQLKKRQNEVDMLNELLLDLNNGSTFSNPFDPFFSRRSIGPSRPYTAESESIEVNVLPVPDSFTGSAWLPAEEVKMQDSWAANPPSLRVGEPVTRTIIMQVKGLASSQIPEIFIPKPAGMKVYPEQAKGEDRNDGNTIYGIQRVDISYIPDKSGIVVIPEINVDWWDVNNKQQQTYTLPEWNLTVAAGAFQANEINQETEVMDDVNPEAESTVEEVFATVPSYWGWEVLLSLFTIIALFLLSLFFINKRLKKSPKRYLKKRRKKELIDRKALYNSLLNACKSNDNKTAADFLIKYAQLISPENELRNLGDLARGLNHKAEVIQELENSLYGLNSNQWQGDDLYQLLKHGLKFNRSERTIQMIGLEPLYPN